MKNLLLWLCVGLGWFSARGAEVVFDNSYYNGKLTAEQAIENNLNHDSESDCMWEMRCRIQEYAVAKGIVFDKTLAKRFPKKLKTIQELRSKFGVFNVSFTNAENTRTESGFEISLHGEDVRNEYFVEGIADLIPDADAKYVHPEGTVKRCSLLTSRLKAMRVELDANDEYRETAMCLGYPKFKQETNEAWGQIVAMFDRLPTPVVEEILTYVEDRIERGNSEWYLTPREADDAFRPKWWTNLGDWLARVSLAR